MKIALLSFILTFCTSQVFATEQAPDLLIYKGDTIFIDYAPLEVEYPQLDSLVLSMSSSISSDCWSGYTAVWHIENDSLFLIKATTCIEGTVINDLVEKVTGKSFLNGRLFAGWVSESVFGPSSQFYNGFLLPEEEHQFVFTKGVLEQHIVFGQLHDELEVFDKYTLEKNVTDIFYSDTSNLALLDTIYLVRGLIKLNMAGELTNVQITHASADSIGEMVREIVSKHRYYKVYYSHGRRHVFDIEFMLMFSQQRYEEWMAHGQ